MSEPDLKRELQRSPAPDEGAAGERSWRVVRRAHARRAPATRRGPARRLAGGVLVALLAAGVALSPAGAEVRDWMARIVDDPPGVEQAAPSLDRLPGGGRLLVDSSQGAWLVGSDGSKRRLGDYEQTSWSPRGLFAAAAEGNTLSAVDVSEQIGDVRWSITADGPVSEPRWSPSGVRVAYLAGRSLRVVAGDGSPDRPLAARAAPVAPAWMPEPEYTGVAGEPAPRHRLAYVGRSGTAVRVVATDSGKLLWRQDLGQRIVDLDWTETERRLAVLTSRQLKLFQRGGREAEGFGWYRGVPALAFDAGEGDRFAVTRWDAERRRSRLSLLEAPGAETIFPGRGRFSGIHWSPRGNRLLLEWKAARQWLFLSPDGTPVRAVSQIGKQFDPGGDGPPGFPTVSGWCCG